MVTNLEEGSQRLKQEGKMWNGLVEIFLELHKIETVVLNCKISEHKNRDLTKIIIVSFVELDFYDTFYDKQVFVIFANSCC